MRRLGGGGGYLLDKEWIEFWNILGGHIIQDDNVIYVEDQGGEKISHLSSINVELLKLLNVKYLLSKIPIINKHFELVSYAPGVGEYHPCGAPGKTRFFGFLESHSLGDLEKFFRDLKCVFHHEKFTPPLYVYKMQDPFLRIYLASAIEILPAISKKDLMDAVFDKKAILRKVSESDTVTNQTFSARGNVEIKAYRQDSIEFEVKTDSRQFVILSDINNQFWKLFIKGKPAPFYNVNIAQTGFFVGEGESIVQFAYCPPRLGAKLGLVSSSCLADVRRHGAISEALD